MERLSRRPQRGQLPGAERPIDAIAQQRVRTEHSGNQRPQLAQKLTESAPLPNVAFSVHRPYRISSDLTEC